MQDGISKLIYYTFNDLIKIFKNDYGYDLSYLKCSILNGNKNDSTIRSGEYIFVNHNLGFMLKNKGIVFDNFKKFFVLAIAKELGKEAIEKYWDLDRQNAFMSTINKYEESNDEYEDNLDKLSSYFALKVYSDMLPKLNQFIKKNKKGDTNEKRQ